MNDHSVAHASLTSLWQSARSDAAGWISVAGTCRERPLDLLARALALGRPFFFRQSADRRHSILGLGDLVRLQAAGPDRLQAVAQAARSLGAPVLLGAFAFSGRRPLTPPFGPFAPADFIVPQLLIEERDGETSVRLFGRSAEPRAEDPADLFRALLGAAAPPAQTGRLRSVDVPGARDAWRAEVLRARDAIRRGSLQKVVLSRTSHTLATAPIDPARVVRALSEREQGCRVFAVHRAGRTFLGATPEGLVAVEDGVAEVPCLAGSTGRGRTDGEDRALGEELLSSGKNRSEHDYVVQAVTRALRDLGLAPQLPGGPELLRLRSLQHLLTPVRAALAEDVSLFDLAAALHPTPAMGGTPPDLARAWICEHERLPRGLYSGGVGFWRSDGSGAIDVAIRCALVQDSRATLWAGCGIVGDSDPDEELRETELKFRPMRQALREAIAS